MDTAGEILNRAKPRWPRKDPSRALPTLPRRTFKIQIFRLLTVLLGITVACTIAEITLRLVGWPAPGLYVARHGPLKLRTPGYLGGAYPPNVRGSLRHYDYDVEWIVNSHGFRDREIVPKRRGEWRIGILGDSFTAGIGVRQEERFADIFAAGTQRLQPHITVWNLGAPSCGTACEAEMLKRVDQDYQLDEIVLAFYGGNDLQDNSSWYSSNPERAVSQTSPVDKVQDWLREHSRLSTFLWVNGIRAWATFEPPGIYSQPELDRFWPDTDRSLQGLVDILGSKKLTILYLPAEPEWSDVVWQEIRSRYHFVDGERHLVKRAVADWSNGHRIEFIDATDWLRKCDSSAACIFPVDGHWKALGHSFVAQGLLSQATWSRPSK